MIKLIWVIVKKEVGDNLRDRRTVLTGLGSVLMMPLLYFALFGLIGRNATQSAERPLQLAIIGADNAPSLISYLKQNNVVILPPPDDAAAALRNRELDVVLLIPPTYGDAFTSGQPAPLELWQDNGNQNANTAVNRTRRLLQTYASQIGATRLLVRGISPQIMNPLAIADIDVSASGAASAAVLSVLATVMLLGAFTGGFYLAVDLTAGERERNSLEPLLLNPVPRWVFVGGKFVAVLIFALAATILATLTYILLLLTPQLQSFTGLQVTITYTAVLQAILIILPVILMAAAVEMLTASFASSFKEAQTYVSYVLLASFLPSTFLSVLPIKQQFWMMFIPTLSQTFLIGAITRGDELASTDVTLATLSTLVVAVAAFIATIRLYSRERIILGG